MKQLVIVAHNLRSAHNVGSLLRTAEGLGVTKVILSGYTPYPSLQNNDTRLPHERLKVDKLIAKTALGAENTQNWSHQSDIEVTLDALRHSGYTIAALEQSSASVELPKYSMPDKLAVILGREVEGVEPELLAQCDTALEIPMFGSKESFNVIQAAAMLGYHWRFIA